MQNAGRAPEDRLEVTEEEWRQRRVGNGVS
jgi:hypothetical protein